ncbi:MAG: hypothetical protein PHT07_24425 [Paludibacter sp.]|nr:hypothetical protein [Paludibacter sp.]
MNNNSLQLVSDVSSYLNKNGYLPIIFKTALTSIRLSSIEDSVLHVQLALDSFTITFQKSIGDYTIAYFTVEDGQINFVAFDSNSVLFGLWKYLTVGGV